MSPSSPASAVTAPQIAVSAPTLPIARMEAGADVRSISARRLPLVGPPNRRQMENPQATETIDPTTNIATPMRNMVTGNPSGGHRGSWEHRGDDLGTVSLVWPRQHHHKAMGTKSDELPKVGGRKSVRWGPVEVG